MQKGLLETIYRNYEMTQSAGLGGGAALTGHPTAYWPANTPQILILVRSRRQPPNSGAIALKKCVFPCRLRE